jgi:hypothetical protein
MACGFFKCARWQWVKEFFFSCWNLLYLLKFLNTQTHTIASCTGAIVMIHTEKPLLSSFERSGTSFRIHGPRKQLTVTSLNSFQRKIELS